MSAPPAQVEHFVSTEPFDPYSIEALTPEQERFYLASQWRMMWWRLKPPQDRGRFRHRSFADV